MVLPLLTLLAPPSGFRPLEAKFLLGIPYVLADVGPETQAWFVLDTGYPYTAYNGTLPAGWDGPRLHVGDARLTFPAKLEPEYRVKPGFTNATKVVGSLGCTFLMGGQVLIDAAGGEVSLRLGGALTQREAERALREGAEDGRGRLRVLPLEENADGFFLTSGRLARRPLRLVFDTGTNCVVLSESSFAAAKGVDLADGLMIRPGEAEKSGQRLIPQMEVGPSRIDAPVVVRAEDDVLGTTVLTPRILVDLPGRAAYWLVPPDRTAEVDAAIGRLIRRSVHTAPDGRLLTRLGGSHPRTVEFVSIQDETVASLREIVGKAASGDPAAVARVAELTRSYRRETRIFVRDGDQTIKLDL